MWLLLEQAHPPASAGQRHSGRQTGKAATDNQNLVHFGF
jgi:hypothetical protein